MTDIEKIALCVALAVVGTPLLFIAFGYLSTCRWPHTIERWLDKQRWLNPMFLIGIGQKVKKSNGTTL